LQAVGVVLMSALIVAPAVAARAWSDRLAVVMILAAAFGMIAGILGTISAHALSGERQSLPTGPVIVLVATVIALASIAVAPRIRRRVAT
jgi:manganese/zinc/iron transport system permease protein